MLNAALRVLLDEFILLGRVMRRRDIDTWEMCGHSLIYEPTDGASQCDVSSDVVMWDLEVVELGVLN